MSDPKRLCDEFVCQEVGPSTTERQIRAAFHEQPEIGKVVLPVRCSIPRSCDGDPWHIAPLNNGLVTIDHPRYAAKILADVLHAIPESDMAVLSQILDPGICVRPLGESCGIARSIRDLPDAHWPGRADITLSADTVNGQPACHVHFVFAHEIGHVIRFARWARCRLPCPFECAKPCRNCEAYANRYAKSLGFPYVKYIFDPETSAFRRSLDVSDYYQRAGSYHLSALSERRQESRRPRMPVVSLSEVSQPVEGDDEGLETGASTLSFFDGKRFRRFVRLRQSRSPSKRQIV